MVTRARTTVQPSRSSAPREPAVGYDASMSTDEDGTWRWSYSRWVGIMYGPVPIGVIVVGIGAIMYYAMQ